MATSLTLTNLDERLVIELGQAAARSGRTAEDLARELIVFGLRAPPGVGPATVPERALSEDEVSRRDSLVEDLRAIRAMTLEPLSFDSTTTIREMRDAG